MRYEYCHDPFGYPVYIEKWVLIPGGAIELLRVEKVIDQDGTVRYYHPTKPSFLYPNARGFSPDEVADSKADLEAAREERSRDHRPLGYDWPDDV